MVGPRYALRRQRYLISALVLVMLFLMLSQDRVFPAVGTYRRSVLQRLSRSSSGGQLVRPARSPQIPPRYPIGKVKGSFAKTKGRLFEIDGKVEYFAGTNAWWLGHLTNNDDVDLALKQIKDTKYKIIRVWGFGDILEHEVPSVNATDPAKVWYQMLTKDGALINYGPDGLERLDYVVSRCEKLGLKLVLPFVNTWADWGGIQKYITAFGGPQQGFYVDDKVKQVYKDWVLLLVNRYKSSPAIFSWQLGNEPRCDGCDTTVITKWAAEISSMIKAADPHHMVSLGDEGWFAMGGPYRDDEGTESVAYSSNGGVDYIANMDIPTLDYATFHAYPTGWGYTEKWANTWIRQHDEVGEKAGKPVVFEEYGCPADHAKYEAPWQEEVLKSGIACDQPWQFGPNGTSVDPMRFGDPNSLYYGSEEYELLAIKHAQAMLDKPVKGQPKAKDKSKAKPKSKTKSKAKSKSKGK